MSSSISFSASAPSINTQVSTYRGAIGDTIYLTLLIKVPEGAYIYGNPKGPGTGKPLEVSVQSPACKMKTPFIDEPKIYYPDGDDFVYVYQADFSLIIPVLIVNEDKSPILVTVSGLMCTNSACMPFSISRSFNFGTKTAVEIFSSPPSSKMIKLGETAPGENEQKKYSNLSSGFSQQKVFVPRFLSSSISNLWYALLLGLTAGIILNFMPCVFPVLGIKLSGIVQQSQERKSRIKTAGFYSAGIFFSFLVLASLVSFAGYRWGTLFQQSSFLIVIILIIFAFALSLFGLFEINMPVIAGKASVLSFENKDFDSFFKGCLSALLSTPCSGPLLGSTLAWALTQSRPMIFAVFIAIGTGLALPYIMISLFPKVLFFIPKPGHWMVTFERLMGFLLLGSALFFLSALNEQLYIPVLSMLLVASIGFWQYGRWGNISRSGIARISSSVILFVFLSASLYWPLTTTPLRNLKISSDYSFSSLLLNEKANKTSVVIFTADWCTNCKFVEQSVLKSAEIEKLFRQNNISVLTADITEKGSEGESLLHQLGSASIPFLAIFPSGENFDRPVCLRDIYTRNDIVKALKISRDK